MLALSIYLILCFLLDYLHADLKLELWAELEDQNILIIALKGINAAESQIGE